jgi:hypothetical protein
MGRREGAIAPEFLEENDLAVVGLREGDDRGR